MARPTLISTQAEWGRALEMSNTAPLLLFKHSLTCPTSTMAWQEFQVFLADRGEGDGFLYAFLEIQNARDVSKEVARSTGIRHESPQALLLKAGRVVWHKSHWDITAESLRDVVGEAEAGAPE